MNKDGAKPDIAIGEVQTNMEISDFGIAKLSRAEKANNRIG